mgnify:CR=1 FL=1
MITKYFRLFLFFFLIGNLLISCKNKSISTRLVSVSILPQKYLTEQIAGDYLTVNVMIPPGMNPATCDLSTEQLKKLYDSDLCFTIGYLPFEQIHLFPVLENRPDIQIVNHSANLQLIHGSCGHTHAAGDEHDGVDPHIWLSPAHARTMATTVYEVLSEKYPEQKLQFEQNYQALLQKIDSIADRAKQVLDHKKDKIFLIYHPALTYFAADYGMEQISIEDEGKEPNPAHLKKIIDLALEKNIHMIFIQSQFDVNNAESVAKQIGGQIIQIDPLTENWTAEMNRLIPWINIYLKNNMTPILELKNVSAGYDHEVILHQVNLKIYEHDFLGIIGPNGGGKTTLLKVILGLLKPYSGEVIYPVSRQNLFGYLPQNSRFDQRFPIDVTEVVLSGLMSEKGLYKSYTRAEKQKAWDLLDQYGMGAYKKAPIGDLSGGQMQRVFLCRAIIASPRILILDEPTTYVDSNFEKEFYTILEELNKSLSIVMVSHDLGTICSYVKTIACVNRELHYHNSNLISAAQLQSYHCPIELITHGKIPHRVLKEHEKGKQ